MYARRDRFHLLRVGMFPKKPTKLVGKQLSRSRPGWIVVTIERATQASGRREACLKAGDIRFKASYAYDANLLIE